MRIAVAAADRVVHEAVRRSLASLDRHEVAWSALDGEEAIAGCARDRPEILVLDVALPGMEADLVRRIMTSYPCAILLLASDPAASVHRVFQALEDGALDVVATPRLDLDGQLTGNARFAARLATLEKIVGSPPTPSPPRERASGVTTVAVGASTGGPQALATLLSGLGAATAAAVVIVQHIDAPFAEGLARWLEEKSRVPVRLAKTGDVPRQGEALLAAGGDHLVLGPGRSLEYAAEPADHPHRPSVDVFFGSLAVHGLPGIAVLLTGMGRDGAEGLLALRQRGWTTIAQDEHTSAVHGMPAAAAELGAAELVLPIEAIGPTIAGLLSRRARGR